YYIGRSVSAYILGRYDPCITEQYSQLINYIKKIGHTLAMASDYPETFQDYRFIILNSEEINAFAVPSGFIFITTGTIKKAKSEDEIAGILAHEISHIVLNHPIKSLKEKNKKRVLAKVVKLGIIFGFQDQNINQNVDLFEDLVNELGQLVINGYDADKEKEADLQAVDLMLRTGYNPNDLKTFISRLKLGDNIHGTTQKRAFYVKQRIEKLSKTY
ncbi:MAG: M48 family metalloprotease, partial [bacterium]|nr:M48 family metalloprotease [bacterium]